jgi:tellurite resistance protein TerC
VGAVFFLLRLHKKGGIYLSTKKALMWVLFWVSLAMLFNVGVYYFMGPQSALEFLGGYIIELSLSVDNLFMFLFIFSCFGIPTEYQRRALNWGIIGAVILRLIFIVLGVEMVNRFEWVLYVFGIILIISGIKMWVQKDGPADADHFKNSRTLRLIKMMMPVTDSLHGEKFFVKQNNIWHATPLFAILVLIDVADLIFAIDSIPAIFSVTTDLFIVYTSNIFAISGLRSMYFVLEKSHRSFHLMKYGVAIVLAFTGVKLSLLFFDIHVPLGASIITIVIILALSIVISLMFPPKDEPEFKCDLD